MTPEERALRAYERCGSIASDLKGLVPQVDHVALLRGLIQDSPGVRDGVQRWLMEARS